VNFKNRTIWLTIIVVIYAALAVTTVFAHALLIRSNPRANAVLEKPPVQVEIFFSEPLEQNLSTIKVYDTNGVVVDVGDVRVDPVDATRITVSLRSLNDGVYTVTWKAVSSIDGHQTVGTFPFAVGNANASAVQAIQQSSTASVPISSLVSKFLLLAALALLAGHRLFIALVWNPAVRSGQEDVNQPAVWVTLYRIGLIGVLFSIGLGILSQAGQTTGTELSLPWDSETGRILIETRLGLIWLARLILILVVAWSAGKPSAWKDWLGFAASVALLFTVTLTSHAATEVKPLLPILGDLLHLIGMTFWLGGLIYLFTGIRQLQLLEEPLRTKLTSLVTSRFSVNAIAFVGLIGLTGFYSAYLRVGTWSALLVSLYGHVLLVKQVFVAGLLIIAAVNFLIISPRLNRARLQGVASPAVIGQFRKILIVELTCAVLLLASVSFLTYLPPAKIVSPVSDFTDIQQVDDIKVEINIAPAHVGANEFMLMLISEDGQPIDSAKQVLLRFTSNQANIPPSELQMIADGGGMYSAKGTYLSMPGKWQVQAVVRRENKFDAFANFDLSLQTPGSVNKSAASSKLSGGLILFIGLLFALITISLKPYPILRFGLGFPLALIAVGIGLYYLTRPVIAELPQANPIPANQDSVAAGTHLFSVNCAPCHGAGGKGDGPLGVVLNPRPADLTLHAIPGVHTDAQLFEWITNGFPGSRMPPFKTRLSDTDRWHLVNFIRTLAPK